MMDGHVEGGQVGFPTGLVLIRSASFVVASTFLFFALRLMFIGRQEPRILDALVTAWRDNSSDFSVSSAVGVVTTVLVYVGATTIAIMGLQGQSQTETPAAVAARQMADFLAASAALASIVATVVSLDQISSGAGAVAGLALGALSLLAVLVSAATRRLPVLAEVRASLASDEVRLSRVQSYLRARPAVRRRAAEGSAWRSLRLWRPVLLVALVSTAPLVAVVAVTGDVLARSSLGVLAGAYAVATTLVLASSGTVSLLTLYRLQGDRFTVAALYLAAAVATVTSLLGVAATWSSDPVLAAAASAYFLGAFFGYRLVHVVRGLGGAEHGTLHQVLQYEQRVTTAVAESRRELATHTEVPYAHVSPAGDGGELEKDAGSRLSLGVTVRLGRGDQRKRRPSSRR